MLLNFVVFKFTINVSRPTNTARFTATLSIFTCTIHKHLGKDGNSVNFWLGEMKKTEMEREYHARGFQTVQYIYIYGYIEGVRTQPMFTYWRHVCQHGADYVLVQHVTQKYLHLPQLFPFCLCFRDFPNSPLASLLPPATTTCLSRPPTCSSETKIYIYIFYMTLLRGWAMEERNRGQRKWIDGLVEVFIGERWRGRNRWRLREKPRALL